MPFILTINQLEAPASPPTAQDAKLIASDEQGSDRLGKSVSISEDGSTAICGAPQEDTGASNTGAAYIFIRNPGSPHWTEQQKLQASDTPSFGFFGWSVSISNDGNTAVVGAYNDNSEGTDAGSAYIFTRSGSTWTQQQKITASVATAEDQFGQSVAISGNGNTIIVGADGDGTNNGAAYVFTNDGSPTWTQQQKLTASDTGSNEFFGWRVSLSNDGDTAIVGAYAAGTGGQAYVYTRSGGTWTEQQILTASNAGTGDAFGDAVALSGDGDTAIVGAYAEDTTASNAGSAYVFTRSGGTWTEQQQIQSDDVAGDDEFGWSVSLSNNGDIALISAHFDDPSGTFNGGSAYIFTRSGGTWTQHAKLFASDAFDDIEFGFSVSLSKDGETALIGAIYDTPTVNFQAGSAYVFV